MQIVFGGVAEQKTHCKVGNSYMIERQHYKIEIHTQQPKENKSSPYLQRGKRDSEHLVTTEGLRRKKWQPNFSVLCRNICDQEQ